MSDMLPKGWFKATLQDIGKWRSGGTPSRQKSEYFGSGIPWVKSGDLKDGPIDKTDEQITELGSQNSSAKVLPTGTVSMALYGATIGKLGIMSFPAATNQACANVVPNSSLVQTMYLYFYLLSERQVFIDSGQGGAQPNISQEIVRAHPIPLAPVNEQQRIATKLTNVLRKIEGCNKRLERIPTILKHFRQSVLAAACSGRLTADWREGASNEQLKLAEVENSKRTGPVDKLIDVPSYWDWLPLEALCDPRRSICYGVIKLGSTIEEGVPCLRTSDVKPLRIETGSVKTIDPVISNAYRRTILQGDEILVNVRGTLGGVAVVPKALRGWNISREVALVPVAGIISQFVAFWIASTTCQNWLTGVAKGVAYTGINIEDLRLLPIALPSLEEQQEIVRRVESLFSLADQLETRYKKGKAYVDKLTQSILAKAFRGEMVPQDPNDEPVEKLLERIRENRTAGKMSRQDTLSFT